MKVCNEIQRRIDRSDDAESFDIEIARHTAQCGDCRRFADEHAALRNLLALTARVTAPPNFDAVLGARLAEVKARKRLAWLGAAFYLRAGAVTAALAVAVLVAQYNGMFGTSPAQPSQPQDAGDPSGMVANAIQQQLPLQFVVPTAPAPGGVALTDAAPSHLATVTAGGQRGNRPRAIYAAARRGAGVPLVAPIDAAFVDGGAILIPGKNGGHDITVPTVSVGAQPMIYGNAGRQPQPTRALTVSF